MNKVSNNNVIGRARGPRGFGGPVEKKKQRIKREQLSGYGTIWRSKR
ncbi:hypothetical protein [Psychrobacillus mangrovi]